MEAFYNPWLVGLSILVAMVVAYTALKLAARVAEAGRTTGRWWLLGGAAAMGMGIWSMHFIGMLVYSVDTPLRYGILETPLSLVIAMITSGFALAMASRPQLGVSACDPAAPRGAASRDSPACGCRVPGSPGSAAAESRSRASRA